MKAIVKGHGKLLLLACAALCCLAAAATAQAASSFSFCVGGQTKTFDLSAAIVLMGVAQGSGYMVVEGVSVPVSVGACAEPGAGPKLHNHSPLCYSKLSDDVAYFESGDLAELLSRGYSVPSAVKSDGSWRFVCNPGAGLTRTGTKLGSDKATIVSDALAGGNDGWWEIVEPKT